MNLTSVVERACFQCVSEIRDPGGEMVGVVNCHLAIGDPRYGDLPDGAFPSARRTVVIVRDLELTHVKSSACEHGLDVFLFVPGKVGEVMGADE